jgi:FKBP-type peptidyl-prolyl cis-trans isomerase (trigger factor)
MNAGQMVEDVRLAVNGKLPVHFYGRTGGMLPSSKAILEKIGQNTEIKIPEILIEEEKKRMLESLKKQVPQLFQISFEDYLTKINKTEKTLMDSFSQEAKKRINNSLILKEIGEREKIEVSEKEVEEGANKILREYPNLKKELDSEKIKDYTKEVIKNEKIFQFLESLTK